MTRGVYQEMWCCVEGDCFGPSGPCNDSSYHLKKASNRKPKGRYKVFIKDVDMDTHIYHDLTPNKILTQSDNQFLIIISKLLKKITPTSLSNVKILIKPNLLKANSPDCVTSAPLIIAVASVLKQRGAVVTVGDSPAFGNAKQVLKSLGILESLKSLGIQVASLSEPVSVRLRCGPTISISKQALDADLILNLPRLKAHCQLGITGAVKNLYGTVPGFRKALYHMIYGKDTSLFSNIIIDISKKLPATVTLMDACLCMHQSGPTGGMPIWLGVMAASKSSHAIDTAFYTAIKAAPSKVPIWNEARKASVRAAFLENLVFPWLSPWDIKEASSFVLPERLEPITFNPLRFIKGRLKSLGRSIRFLR